MLNDLALVKAEQVECDHRSVTSDALVSGMQQYEIAVHERAIDCYIGGRGTRHFRSEGLHSSKTISKVRVMLLEGFTKIPVDHCWIFLAKDVDHSFASVGAQHIRGRHGSALRLNIRQGSN